MRTFIISIIFLALISCGKDDTQNEIIELTGILKVQGITTYQYGSHILTNSTTFYALTSKTIELDQYADDEVMIVGHRIDGYPVDGGPEYVEVTKVLPI